MDGPHYFPTAMSPSRTLDAVTSATTHLTAAGHHAPSPLYQSALDVAAAVDASTTFTRFDGGGVGGGVGVGGMSSGIPRIPLAEGTSYSPHSLRGSAIQQHLPSSADHSAQHQHQQQHYNQFATSQQQHQFPQRGAFIGTSASHALPYGGPAPVSGGALYTTAVPPSAPLSTAKKKRFRKRRGDVANFGWSDYEPETATGDGGGSNTGDPDGGLDDGGEQTGERMGTNKTGHLPRHTGTPRSTTPRRNDRNQSRTPQHTPRGQRTGRQSVGQRTPRGTPRGQAPGNGHQRSPRGHEHGDRSRDPQSQGHGNSALRRASPQQKHRYAHTPGSKMGRYVEFPGLTVSTPRGQQTKSSGHGAADRDAYTTNNDAFYENGSLGVRGTSGARSGAAANSASAGAGGFGGWMLEHGEQGSLPLQAVQHIATLERDFAALQGEHERLSELLMHSSRFASTAAVQVAEADARLQIERESDADYLLLVVNPLLRRSVAFGCANQTRSATIQDPAVTAVLDLHKALEAHRVESAKGTDNMHEAVSSMARRMEKHLSDAAMESGDGAAHRSSEMVSEVRLVGRSTVDALQHSELALGAKIAAQSQSVQSSVDTQMGKLQVTLAGLHTDLREFATKANASVLIGTQQHQHDHHGGASVTDGDGGETSSSARVRELSELLEKERREKEQVQVALGQAQAQAAAAQQSQQQQLEIIMQLTALKERDTHSGESRQAHQHSLEQRYGVTSAGGGGGGGGVRARDIPAASLPLLLAEQGLSPADALALASSFVSTKSSESRWAASTSVLLMKEVNAHVNDLSQIFLDACDAKAELCVAALTGKHSSSEEGGLRKRQHQTVGLLSGVPMPTNKSLGTSGASGIEGGELSCGALASTGVQVEPVMYSSGTGTHDSFSVKVQSVQTDGAVLPSDVAPSSSSQSQTAATSAAAAIDPRVLQQLVSALHHLPRSTTAGGGGGGSGTQHHQSQGATTHVPPIVVPDSGNGSSDRAGSVGGIPHNAPLHESVFGSGFGTHSLSSERSLSGGLPTVSISPATPHNAQHMMLPAAAADYVTARDSSSSSRHDSHDPHHGHTAMNQQRGAAIGGNVTTVPSSRPAPRGVEKDSPRRKDSRHGAEQHAAPAVGVQPSPRRRSSLEQSLGSGRALDRQSSQQRGSNANQQNNQGPTHQCQNASQSQQLLGSPQTADSAPIQLSTSSRLGAGVSPHSSSIGSETRQRSKVPERRPRATRTNSAQLSPALLSPDAKPTAATAAPETSKNDNTNVPSASSSAVASAPRAQSDSAHGKLDEHAAKSSSPHRLSATERVAEALGPNAFGDHADSDTSNMTLSGLDDDDDDAVSGKSSPNPKGDAATRRPSKVAATPAATSTAASVKVSTTSSKSAGAAAAPKAVVKPTSAFDEDTPSPKKQRKPTAKKQHSFFDDSSSGGDHDTDNAATHDTADHHGHPGASATSVDTAHGKGHSTTGGSSVFSSRQASTHGAHDGSDHTKAKIDDNRNHTQSQRRQGEKHLTVSALPPSPLEDMEVRSTHPPPPALGADVLKPVPVTSADTKRAAVVVPKKLSDWDNSDDDDVDDNGGGHDGHGTDEAEIESLTGSLLELEREALSPIPHGATAAKPTAKTTAKTTSSSLSASAAQSTKPPAAAAASSKPATVFASGTSSTAAPMTNPSQLSLARGSADGLGSGGTTPSPLAAQTKQSANTNTNTTVPKQNMNYLSPTSASSTRGGSGSGGGNGGGSPLTPGASAAASRGATPEPRRGRKVSFLGEGDADDGSPSGNASTANAPSHIPIKSPTSMAPGGLGAGAGAAGAGDGQQTKVVPGTHQAPLASLSISSAVTASDSSFSLSPRGTNPSFGLSPLTGGGQQASTSPGGMQQGQASTVRPGKPFVMSPDGRGATPSPGGLVGGGGNTLASAGAAGHFTRAGGGGGGAVSGSRGPSPGATPHAVSANASPGQSPGSSIATAVSAGGRQLPSLSGSSAKATTSAADFFSGVGKKKQLGGAKKLSPL